MDSTQPPPAAVWHRVTAAFPGVFQGRPLRYGNDYHIERFKQHIDVVSGATQAASAQPAPPIRGPRSKKPRTALTEEEPKAATNVFVESTMGALQKAPLRLPSNADGSTG